MKTTSEMASQLKTNQKKGYFLYCNYFNEIPLNKVTQFLILRANSHVFKESLVVSKLDFFFFSLTCLFVSFPAHSESFKSFSLFSLKLNTKSRNLASAHCTTSNIHLRKVQGVKL